MHIQKPLNLNKFWKNDKKSEKKIPHTYASF